jgi:hypothetical protein
MKKYIFFSFILLVILIPAFLFAASCDSGGEGEDFYIRFTMDGQEYILTFGYSDGSTDAPVAALQHISDTQDGIFLYGSNWEESGDTSGILVSFLGSLLPYIKGEYIGDYTLAVINGFNSIYVGDGYLSINIWDGLDGYQYRATGGTVTFTSFGDVGGAVEGTFDVTFTIMLPAALGDSPLTVTGGFRLLRVSVDDFPID